MHPDGGYLFNWIYDLRPARLGRGGWWVALFCGCPRHQGCDSHMGCARQLPPGEWLKRGLTSSK